MPPSTSAYPSGTGLSAAVMPLPFEQMFEDAPFAASLSRRADGRLVAVNQAWETLSGIARDQAIGRSTIELGLWPDATQRQAYLDSLKEQDKPRCTVMIDGRARHLRLHTSVLGGDELLLVYLLDISHEVASEKERDRTQKELRAANLDLQHQVELHAAIEKLAMVGHWTNAHDDDTVNFSPGLFEITGLAPANTLERTVGRGGIHPEDMPAWLEARAARDGRELDFRWTRPDGAVRWMRTRISQTAVKGIPQTDFGVVQDITAQREAIDAHVKQLQLLQHITARVPGVVFQSRMPVKGWGSFEFVSDMVRDLFDLTPEQLYQGGRILFSRVHADDQQALAHSIWSSTNKLEPWRTVFRVSHPGKGTRWCSAEGLPQAQPDGSVLWHGYVHDVTEARQAAQALDRQHRMLDAVRQAQAAYIEADDKRQAFEGLLKAFLSVTNSAYGFVGEVLYDPQGQPYLKSHAITDISWDEASRRVFAEQMDSGMEFRNLKTLFGHALLTGETVLTNHPETDARRGGCRTATRPCTRSWGFRWRSVAG